MQINNTVVVSAYLMVAPAYFFAKKKTNPAQTMPFLMFVGQVYFIYHTVFMLVSKLSLFLCFSSTLARATAAVLVRSWPGRSSTSSLFHCSKTSGEFRTPWLQPKSCVVNAKTIFQDKAGAGQGQARVPIPPRVEPTPHTLQGGV